MIVAYLVNVIVSSWLSFITLALVMGIFTAILRGRHPRIHALCLIVPILKLPIDLLRFDYAHWAFYVGENPITTETGTRMLNLWVGSSLGMGFQLQSGNTFTLGDWLVYSLPTPWIDCFIFAFCVVSICLWAIRLTRFIARRRVPLPPTTPYDSNITPLHSELKFRRVKVGIVNWTVSPFACQRKHPLIVLPRQLIQYLSQGELEAVISHELDHLRWHDGSTRMLINCIGSLFWWVPTSWLSQRIEQSQEEACDRSVSHSIDLANAIHQTSSLVLTSSPALRSGTLIRRVHLLLFPRKPLRPLAWIATCGILWMSQGRFWIP